MGNICSFKIENGPFCSFIFLVLCIDTRKTMQRQVETSHLMVFYKKKLSVLFIFITEKQKNYYHHFFFRMYVFPKFLQLQRMTKNL